MRSVYGWILAAIGIAIGGAGTAGACVLTPVQCFEAGGQRCSAQTLRRMAVERRSRVRAELRNLADAGAADPARDYAADLARTFVPLIRPAYAPRTSCGLEPAEQDPAGYLEQPIDADWLDRASVLRLRRLPQGLPLQRPRRDSHNRRCAIEYRTRVAAILRERHDRATLRDVWREITVRGFLRPAPSDPARISGDAPLLAFTGLDRTGGLAYGPVPFRWAPGEDDPSLPERARRDYLSLQVYLGRNPAARAVLASVTGFVGDGAAARSDDAAVCPEAAAVFGAALAADRAVIAEALREAPGS